MLELKPRSAFDGLLPGSTSTAGLQVLDRDGAALASVVVRRGQREALRAALRSRFGLELRDGPVLSTGEGLILAGTGADSWLAVSTGPAANLGAELADRLGACAAVCEQSDGYGLLRLSGPEAARVLQRLLPVDLHPRAFPVGAVASTLAAHMPLLAWRLDAADFEVAVFRSYAASLVLALSEAAGSPGRDGSASGRG
jgi:sarcosine oxidase subunit gamma